MPITEVADLWETDRHWIYRAIAVQQAQNLAAPIREQHEKKMAKERAEAAREAERAAIREAKRERYRNRKEHQEMHEAAASD